MKNNIARLILIATDLLTIFVSISLAYFATTGLEIANGYSSNEITKYLDKLLIYIVILTLFFYEGVYTKRYDFWHESRLVIKSLGLSFLIIMSYLALLKNTLSYSNIVIITAFIFMVFLIPIMKKILKTMLYKIGLWYQEAKVYGDDEFVFKEIFQNHYMGYVESDDAHAKTVFINSKYMELEELQKLIDNEIRKRKEVIFIPLVNEYNMTQSNIYELSNARTNLIELHNRLKSRLRIALQQIFNYVLAILILPILLPTIGILAYMIKKESPGPVFFAHNRIGKNGTIVPTLKFRSMYQDAKERLEKLLEENEEIRKEWETNFKLKNDPRVTKIGAILRKTSLDELPQIFNVLKGEMNFVGPRPVIQKELDLYYKDDAEYYNMVKPGITGLWQVSGRSDTDYDFRVATDKWYVQNWSLWLDIVILFKTVKVVLFREGAY